MGVCWSCTLLLTLQLSPCTDAGDVDPGWYVAAERDMQSVIRGRDAFEQAMTLADKSRYSEALDQFRIAVKEMPEVTDAWANAATVLERLDRHGEAAALLNKGIKSRKPSRRGKLCSHLCSLLLMQYESNGRVENREAAGKPCKCALEHMPNSSRVQFSVATWHAQRLEYPQSLHHFREGLRLDPGDTENRLNMANVLLRSGDGTGAVEAVRQILRDGGNTTSAHRMLSTAIQTVEPFSSEAIYHKRVAMVAHFQQLPVGTGRLACTLEVEVNPTQSRSAQVSSRLLHPGGTRVEFDVPLRTFPGSKAPPHVLADGKYVDKAAYLVTYHSVYMAGRSGSVFSDCSIFPGDHLYDSPAAQELPVETLKRGGSDHVQTVLATADRPVASVMQGKWYNHYHWLCETVSRIVLLAESVLKDDPRSVLLVPSERGVIDQTLELLGPDLVPMDRVIRWDGAPGTRHFFPVLHTVFFHQDRADDVHELNDPWYVYFPQQAALHRVRKLIQAGVARRAGVPNLDSADGEGRILYVSRNDVGTRNVRGEEGLVTLLNHYIGTPFVFLQGKKLSLSEQFTAFWRADVLIGPQGSGLANFVASRPGTHLVMFPMAPYDDNILAFAAVALGLQLWMVADLTAFYYMHYNATLFRCKQVLLTVREVLRTLSADSAWSENVLERPHWRDFLSLRYEDVPAFWTAENNAHAMSGLPEQPESRQRPKRRKKSRKRSPDKK